MLREERRKQGISMEELATRAGLSQSMISLLERDLRNPTLDTLLRITDVLEIDLPDVLRAARAAALKGNK
jgi:transcriptional regulator with XRE-family HTH domain